MNGQRLRELRKAKKLTQYDLSQYLNSVKSSISMYENGINQPDNEALIKLAELFQVSVDYLLGRTDIPHQVDVLQNIAYFGDDQEQLTEDEAEFLKESLLMYRKLQERRRGK